MEEELRFHLEMEENRLAREGLDSRDAHRRARVAFGGRDKYREDMRDGQGLAWLSGLRLDLKLGLRMLAKYPMLTMVAGIAITVATAIGVGATEFVRDLLTPKLPLEDGDRSVRLYHVDSENGGRVLASLYDLELWRASVSSLEDLGAYTTMEQGFVSDRGEVGTVSLAQISASAFRLTRVPPALGRFLTDADERPGATPVVVLGHGPWQTLLAGDPDAIGRTVQLGGTTATIVGVMPEGYAFPQVQNAWVTLRINSGDVRPESAPRAAVFARLAPGTTLDSARAELDVVGRRAAADFPEVYERLGPRVDGFADRATDGPMVFVLSGVRILFVFLLIVVCANVARAKES